MGDVQLQVTSVTITTPDPLSLAAFYARLLDRPVTAEAGPRPGESSTAGWAQIRSTDGSRGLTLNFEYEKQWTPPTWPSEPGEQHATQHLDIRVSDLGPFSAISPLPYLFLMVLIVTFAMIFMYRLQDSRIGRSWNAIREDELAAAANGINTVTTKLAAFALGATTAGFAGVLNASKLTIVDPTQFLFTVSFTVLAMVVLGGMGNIAGVAVGAFVLYNVQAVLLKQLNALFEGLNVPILENIDFVKYQYLLFGIALVLMMLFRPEGLFPSQRRRAELHAAEEELPDEEEPTEPVEPPNTGVTEDTRV